MNRHALRLRRERQAWPAFTNSYTHYGGVYYNQARPFHGITLANGVFSLVALIKNSRP